MKLVIVLDMEGIITMALQVFSTSSMKREGEKISIFEGDAVLNV